MNISTANTLNTTYKNSSITFWLLLVILSVYSPLNNAATLKANNGFEDGSFGDMLPHGGGVETIVKSPVATGSYSSSFDLINGYPASKERYRAEAWFSSKKGKFSFEKEYWFSLDYRYEDWARDSNPEIAPFQIHTKPSRWAHSCQFNNAVGTAPFLMLSENDEVRFYTYPGQISWRAPIQKQKWQTITVHFRISTGSTGFIEAWKDGIKLFRVDGANSSEYDACGGRMGEPFFNIGIYKWDWKRKVTDSKRRHLLIDNLKIAEGTNAYFLNAATLTTMTPRERDSSDQKRRLSSNNQHRRNH